MAEVLAVTLVFIGSLANTFGRSVIEMYKELDKIPTGPTKDFSDIKPLTKDSYSTIESTSSSGSVSSQAPISSPASPNSNDYSRLTPEKRAFYQSPELYAMYNFYQVNSELLHRVIKEVKETNEVSSASTLDERRNLPLRPS
jgi:hypothetical protein